MSTGYAAINGASLYYEITGEGGALVLIHSLLLHCGMWEEQVTAFATKYKVLRYDLSGFGRSQPPTTSDVNDLAALLDHLHIEQICLLGLSMGAEIALNFTLAHPQRVHKLVLVSSGLDGYDYSEQAQKNWENFITPVQNRDFARAREVFLKQVVDGPISPAAPEIRERTRQMMETYTFANFFPPEHDTANDSNESAESSAAPDSVLDSALEMPKTQLERLSEIQAPTLVIVGDRDQADTINVGKVLARDIPNARLVTISGAAHIVNMEQPATFNRAVLDFLTEDQ